MEWGNAIDQFLLDQTQHVSPSLRWLLLQTVYTGPTRRRFLHELALQPGRPLLDLGTGFGAMALELSQHFQAPVIALDRDPECLKLAQMLQRHISVDSVTFTMADVTALDPGQGPFYAMFARFLLQHVPDPQSALAHWLQYLEPGGFLYLEDADDGFTVQYPPPPTSWDKLLTAFRRLQAGRGGNREVGRQLAHLASDQHLAIRLLKLTPWTAFVDENWHDAAVQFEVERVNNEKEALIAHGYLAREEFDEGMAAYAASFPKHSFISNATVHLLAQKV